MDYLNNTAFHLFKSLLMEYVLRKDNESIRDKIILKYICYK